MAERVQIAEALPDARRSRCPTGTGIRTRTPPVALSPARAIAPNSGAAATRVLAAEQALQSHDLGSMQEEHLYTIVAASSSWDEASGFGSVEASRAAIAHPVDLQ